MFSVAVDYKGCDGSVNFPTFGTTLSMLLGTSVWLLWHIVTIILEMHMVGPFGVEDLFMLVALIHVLFWRTTVAFYSVNGLSIVWPLIWYMLSIGCELHTYFFHMVWMRKYCWVDARSLPHLQMKCWFNLGKFLWSFVSMYGWLMNGGLGLSHADDYYSGIVQLECVHQFSTCSWVVVF